MSARLTACPSTLLHPNQEYTGIDLSWQQRHLQMTPLFAATLASQPGQTQSEAYSGMGEGMLRATQQAMAFTPTQGAYHKLELTINKFRCYEAKIEESEKGGLFYICLMTSKFIYFQCEARCSEHSELTRPCTSTQIVLGLKIHSLILRTLNLASLALGRSHPQLSFCKLGI